mgnify:CR=1 FL=1
MSESSNEVFFSVIIPTRNRPVEFKKALDSVLAQSFKEFEIIVVNDGTNEQFQKAYKQLKKSSPKNVHYIRLIQRSRGHGHCFGRNQGVDIAKGDFICFLDDDDYWTDNHFLARAAKEIKKHNADFYFANQKAITQDGRHVANVWVEDLPEKLPPNDPRLKQIVFPVTIPELIQATGFPHQNCWVISKQLYNDIGGMDENLRYEPDRDIYIRALDRAECILYDRTQVSLHNIPDNAKKNNASTLTSKKQKLLFQLRTFNKGILFSEHDELIQFCIKSKGYALKKLAMMLSKEKRHKRAYLYAKEALGTSFTYKWLGFTVICWAKNIGKSLQIEERIISQIRLFYHETLLGKMLLTPVKKLMDAYQFNFYKDKASIEQKYQRTFGKLPDLETPETFNEKIQWLKLYDKTPLHTYCADKLSVRQIVEQEIGKQYLVPLIKTTKNINDITPDWLPDEPCVIKTNHDSGNIFIIKDKEKVDFSKIRERLKMSMRHNYYHSTREWQYKNIVPTILVEKFINDGSTQEPKDFKFHCFNGEPLFIHVDTDRTGEHQRSIYDNAWNKQPFKIEEFDDSMVIDKPKNLAQMLNFARILARPFPFARVDFYEAQGKLYFGEITFHPASGFDRFIPDKWDAVFGDKLHLHKSGTYEKPPISRLSPDTLVE